MFEQAVFTDIMAARKEYHWLFIGRNHEVKANATDIGLNLAVDFFIELFGLFLIGLVGVITHFHDQVGGVIFDSSFHTQLLFDLFSFALLVPRFPFLAMLL